MSVEYQTYYSTVENTSDNLFAVSYIPVIGNSYFVFVVWSTGGEVSEMSDDAGNSFGPVPGSKSVNGGDECEWFYAPDITFDVGGSASNLSCLFDSNVAFKRMIVVEVTGIEGSDPIVDAAVSTDVTTPTETPAVDALAGGMILTGSGANANVTYSAGAQGTLIVGNVATDTGADYFNVPSDGTYTPGLAFTGGPTAMWTSAISLRPIGDPPQVVYPNADISRDAGWTRSAGANDWDVLNDDTSSSGSETDYMECAAGSVAQKFRVDFQSLVDPGVDTDHKIKVRHGRAGAGGQWSTTWRFYQDTTLLTTVGPFTVGTTIEDTHNVLTTVADDITDYTNLRLEIEATAPDPNPPTYVGQGGLAVVTTGNVSPALPGSLATDDILIMRVMTNAANTFPTISGWTKITGMGTENDADQSTATYWRRHPSGGTSAPSFTIAGGTALGTNNGLYARIHAYRGCVNSGDPFEGATQQNATATSTTVTMPAVTTTGANRLVVHFCTLDDDNTFGTTPSGYATNGTAASSATGGDAAFHAYSKTRTAAGTEASTSTTQAAADFYNVGSFALVPAPDASTFRVYAEQIEVPAVGTNEYLDSGTVNLKFTILPNVDIAEFIDAVAVRLNLTPITTQEGREWTDSNTTYLDLIPSGVEGRESADVGTVFLDLQPSGVENYETVDSGTVGLKLTPSSTDTAAFVDANTVSLVLSPSGTDIRERFDTGTVALALQPSATEAAQFADADTVSLKLTPSGVDVYTGATHTTDADTVTLKFTPSTQEEYGRTDVGTVSLKLTPSAVENAQFVDTGVVTLVLQPSAVENFQGVEAASVYVDLVPSGTDEQSGTTTDVGTVNLVFTPSSTDAKENVDQATVSLRLTGSSTHEYTRLDAGTVSLVFTPSGTDTQQFVETGVVYLDLEPSGSEQHELPAGNNVATVYLDLTPGTLVEVWYMFDTLLIGSLVGRWSGAMTGQFYSGTLSQKWSAGLRDRRWGGGLRDRQWSLSGFRRWGGLLDRK